MAFDKWFSEKMGEKGIHPDNWADYQDKYKEEYDEIKEIAGGDQFRFQYKMSREEARLVMLEQNVNLMVSTLIGFEKKINKLEKLINEKTRNN